MQTFHYYKHKAGQKKVPNLEGSLEENNLFIRLKLCKYSGWHRVISDPLIWDYKIEIAHKDFRVNYSHFKWQLSDNNDSSREYETLISKYLRRIGVPEDKHPIIVHKLFQVVRAAVSPADPVVVYVWDVIHRIGDRQSGPNLIPASISSIQRLEQVSVPDTDTTCAICLDDFEQVPFTRLPCTHHFHVHCIVQCLNINHLCPLCRYPMPTQED